MTLLADLTWPEAARLAAEGALLAVPVGSTEQHGPHLPLSTDTDIAAALAVRLAALRPGVVVAPPVSYGSSGEHAGFAGTLSIGHAALELVLTELGRSAAETFGHLVFVCAHGGNAVPARQAVARLRAESRAVLLWMPCAETRPGPAPAGRPRRTDRDRAAAGPDPGPGPYAARRGREPCLADPADARAAGRRGTGRQCQRGARRPGRGLGGRRGAAAAPAGCGPGRRGRRLVPRT